MFTSAESMPRNELDKDMRRQIYRYLFTDIDICLYVTNISFENTIQLISAVI